MRRFGTAKRQGEIKTAVTMQNRQSSKIEIWRYAMHNLQYQNIFLNEEYKYCAMILLKKA